MAAIEQIKRSQFILGLMRINRKYGFRGRPVIDASTREELRTYKSVKSIHLLVGKN